MHVDADCDDEDDVNSDAGDLFLDALLTQQGPCAVPRLYVTVLGEVQQGLRVLSSPRHHLERYIIEVQYKSTLERYSIELQYIST